MAPFSKTPPSDRMNRPKVLVPFNTFLTRSYKKVRDFPQAKTSRLNEAPLSGGELKEIKSKIGLRDASSADSSWSYCISYPARGKGCTGKGFGISYNLKRVYYAFLLLPKPSSPMVLIDRTAHVHVQIPSTRLPETSIS